MYFVCVQAKGKYYTAAFIQKGSHYLYWGQAGWKIYFAQATCSRTSKGR